MSPKPDHQLDASGLYCPEPVMLLHNKIRDMAEGELLELLATDPSTVIDLTGEAPVLVREGKGDVNALDIFA